MVADPWELAGQAWSGFVIGQSPVEPRQQLFELEVPVVHRASLFRYLVLSPRAGSPVTLGSDVVEVSGIGIAEGCLTEDPWLQADRWRGGGLALIGTLSLSTPGTDSCSLPALSGGGARRRPQIHPIMPHPEGHGCRSGVSRGWVSDGEDVAWRAAERVAESGQGREANRLRAVVLEDRQVDHTEADAVGKLRQAHATLVEQGVDVADDARLLGRH